MKAFIFYAAKAAAVALAYVLGAMVGAAVLSAVGASLPALPAGADADGLPLLSTIAALTLGLGLGPLAAGLGVGFRARWATLALLVFVCLGVNTAIEAALFTTLGGSDGMIVLNVFTSLAVGAALAALFRPAGEEPPWAARLDRFRRQFPAGQWAWRLAAALLAWPVIYLAFGMTVAPWVVPAYEAAQFGLVLPGMGQILPVQLLRSALFLGASVPALVAWRGSRRGLTLALAAAHFVLNGLFGLLQATWWPVSLRTLHTVEILGDSLVYAAVLVLLLARPRSATPSAVTAAA